MTEEEARKKQCPNKIEGTYPDSYYETTTHYAYALCIASDCMRWPECLSWWIEHEKGKKVPEDKEERVQFMKAFRANLTKDKFLKNIATQIGSLCKKFPTP